MGVIRSVGILASVIGLLSLILNWQLPGKMNRFFLVDYQSLADDDGVESYNYSPGPLNIDTVCTVSPKSITTYEK